MFRSGSGNDCLAGVTALLRVRDLHIEHRSAAPAASKEAKQMVERHLENTLQSKEYICVVEELASSHADRSVQGGCLSVRVPVNAQVEQRAETQKAPSFDWNSTILCPHCDILPQILPFFCKGNAYLSMEELKLSCVCCSLASVGKQFAVSLNRRLPNLTWRTVQFVVDNPSHFIMIVQLSGVWSNGDSFRLGLAPTSMPLDGEGQGYQSGIVGCKYGFWLSPKSGRLQGEDGSYCVVPALSDLDFDRNCRGLDHGEAKGKGKRSRTMARAGRLSVGTLWALHYRAGVLEFFFAKSRQHAFESLGPAQFKSTVVGRGGVRPLPADVDGYVPSVLCRCPVREAALEILDSRGEVHLTDAIPSAVLTVVHVASPPADAVTVSIAGRHLDCIAHVPLNESHDGSIHHGPSAMFRCCFDAWKIQALSQPVKVLRACPRLQCIGVGTFALEQRVDIGFRRARWIRIPFEVEDPHSFQVAARIEGNWLTCDEFLIGVEPKDHQFDPYENDTTSPTRMKTFAASGGKGYRGEGRKAHPIRAEVRDEFFLNPRTGMLAGWYYLAGLADWSFSRHKGAGKGNPRTNRNVRGIAGDGLSSRLSSNHIWAMRLRENRLSFFLFDGLCLASLGGADLAPDPNVEEDGHHQEEDDQEEENVEEDANQDLEDAGEDGSHQEDDNQEGADIEDLYDDFYDFYVEREHERDIWEPDPPTPPTVPWCHAGYRPVLWVLCRSSGSNGEVYEGRGKGTFEQRSSAVLRVVPWPPPLFSPNEQG